jgi:hypothetical protein
MWYHCFMKQLPLTNSDKFALVDEDVYEIAIKHSEWWLNKDGYVISTRGGGQYGKTPQLWLHHLAIGPRPKGLVCDHGDLNTLNYQRSNLGYVTRNRNAHNTRPRRGNISGLKGVTWHKKKQHWQANITVNGKAKYLGCSKDKLEAAKMYDDAARRVFGELAKVNIGE